MSIETRIAKIIRDHGWTCEYHEPVSGTGECSNCDESHVITAQHIAAELFPLITTMAELDALPDGTVVRSSDGYIYEMTPSKWWGIGYGADQLGSENVHLPARVIDRPERNEP